MIYASCASRCLNAGLSWTENTFSSSLKRWLEKYDHSLAGGEMNL